MAPKDIRQKICDILSERGPLLRRDILAEFHEEVDLEDVPETINRLVRLQILNQALRNRVADFGIEERLKAEARKLISDRPLSRKQLAGELHKPRTGPPRPTRHRPCSTSWEKPRTSTFISE